MFLIFVSVLLMPVFSECLHIKVDSAINYHDHEVIIKKGDTLNLTCVGDRPLEWAYPRHNTSEVAELPSFTTIGTETKNGDEYSLKLSLQNAIFMDTGFFSCRPAGQPPSQEVDQSPSATSLYVYVEDDNHLVAVPESFMVIAEEEYDTLVIPCRPTLPSVNVTLFDTNNILVVPDSEYLGSIVEYSPYTGFTFKEVTAYVGGVYTCTGNRRDQSESVLFDVSIFPPSDSIDKPFINDSQARHVLIGDTVILDCSVKVDPGIIISLEWVIPHPEDISTGRVVVEDVPNEIVQNALRQTIDHKLLKIKNVTTRDQGVYICNVTDHSHNMNQNQYNLRLANSIIDKPVINDSQVNYLIVGDTATLDCYISLDPGVNATLDWIIPYPEDFSTGHAIIEDGPREFINEPHRKVVEHKILKIINVTFQDEDVYVCNVTDHENNTNQTFHYLHVYIANSAFLDLTVPEDKAVAVVGTESFSWVVDIESLPKHPINVTWYRYDYTGAEIILDEESKKYKIKTGKYGSTLTINNLDEDDTGVYRIAVSNGVHSSVDKSLNLTLNVQDIQDRAQTLRSRRFRFKNINRTAAHDNIIDSENDKSFPRFVRTTFPNANQKVLTGQNLRWDCVAEGQASIIWYKNGEEIEASNLNTSEKSVEPHIQFFHNNSAILISKIKKSDAGAYSCRAVNKIGHTSKRIILQVVEDGPNCQ